MAKKKNTDYYVVISFQVVEQDPDTLNLHALVDRIGIDVFRDPEGNTLSEIMPSYQASLCQRYKVKYEFEDLCFRKICTKFTLPFNESDLEEIVKEIENRIRALDKMV